MNLHELQKWLIIRSQVAILLAEWLLMIITIVLGETRCINKRTQTLKITVGATVAGTCHATIITAAGTAAGKTTTVGTTTAGTIQIVTGAAAHPAFQLEVVAFQAEAIAEAAVEADHAEVEINFQFNFFLCSLGGGF